MNKREKFTQFFKNRLDHKRAGQEFYCISESDVRHLIETFIESTPPQGKTYTEQDMDNAYDKGINDGVRMFYDFIDKNYTDLNEVTTATIEQFKKRGQP